MATLFTFHNLRISKIKKMADVLKASGTQPAFGWPKTLQIFLKKRIFVGTDLFDRDRRHAYFTK